MTLIFYKIEDTYPAQSLYPILYKTKKGKWGIVRNRVLDEWFADKYSVVEWAYLPDEYGFD